MSLDFVIEDLDFFVLGVSFVVSVFVVVILEVVVVMIVVGLVGVVGVLLSLWLSAGSNSSILVSPEEIVTSGFVVDGVDDVVVFVGIGVDVAVFVASCECFI